MGDTFKNILVGFILFGLFGFLILTAVSNMAGTYDKDTGVIDDTYNIDDYEDYVEGVEGAGATSWEKFQAGSVFSVAGIVVSGIFSIATGLGALIMTPINLLAGVIALVIGDPSLSGLIFGVITTILFISVILGIWSIIKSGQ